MSIPVIYYDNTEDHVPNITLDQLLSSHRIKMFYRFSEGWVIVEAGMLRGKGGASSGMYAGPERRIFMDQEETGSEQRELWNSQDLIKRIYEESPVGIGICDSFGKLLDANQAYLDMYGLHEISETGAFNLFVDPNIPAGVKESLRNDEPARFEMVLDFDRLRTSGLYNTRKSGITSVDMLVSPIVDTSPGMCLYVVQVQDISRHKQAEAKVHAIQHGEAIVKRAGVVADALNNQLQVVLGNVYLARQQEIPDRARANFLERAETAALNAGLLTDRLTAIPITPTGEELSDFSELRRDTETGTDEPERGIPEKRQGESGRVLVMDDTEAVRRISGALLMRLGYDVEFARDGDEAVRIYEDADRLGQPFDLVILDLTVTGGSGARESIGRMLEVDPDIRAVVSSGHHDDPLMTEFRRYGFKGVLAKPYTLKDLSRTVEAAKHRSG